MKVKYYKFVLKIDQESAFCLVVHVDDIHAALADAGAGALFGIEVVLASLSRQDLSVLGDLEALQI